MTSYLDDQLSESEVCDEGTCTVVPMDKRWEETINGITYEVIVINEKTPKTPTWSGSKQLCEDYGFQLPVPDSEEFNNFLTNAAPDVYGEIHLGIRSDTSQANTAYKFSNVYTNEDITYSSWHRAEPNDGRNTDAVVGLIVNTSDGYHSKWYDFNPRSNRGWRKVHHICMQRGKNIFSI